MKIFTFNKKKSKSKRPPKTLKQILSDTFLREVKKDPELMKQLAFVEAGHGDLLEKESTTEKKKREIDEFITSKALEDIKNNPELADDFIQEKVSEIISGGKRPRRSGRNEEAYFESDGPLSSLKQALADIDDIAELREKLSELGVGENNNNKGFFSGMNMEKIMEALPYIAAIIGKSSGNNNNGHPSRVYVVNVNGHDQELNESEYRSMLQTGKIKLNTKLIPQNNEQSTPSEESEESIITPVTFSKNNSTESNNINNKQPEPASKSWKELPDMVKGIDYSEINTWFDMEPEEFVKTILGSKEEYSQIIKGFLSTADYLGIVNMITPYRYNPEVSVIIERILSEEGKEWLEKTIELIKGEINGRPK